jgi:hypothetical protein
MTMRLAFLHTSPAHVATFDALLAAAAPGWRALHHVDEALLTDAQRLGADEPALVARVQAAMHAAAAGGAAAVVCTCSTIGGAAERTPTGGRFIAARIDRAMADRAVGCGPRILVVAALPGTLAPTAALLHESAQALGRPVALREALVADAWPHFVAGERAAYVDAVARGVRDAVLAPARGGGGTDAIVLAQASMAPAADALAGLGIEVLASPRLGVQAIVERLLVRR